MPSRPGDLHGLNSFIAQYTGLVISVISCDSYLFGLTSWLADQLVSVSIGAVGKSIFRRTLILSSFVSGHRLFLYSLLFLSKTVLSENFVDSSISSQNLCHELRFFLIVLSKFVPVGLLVVVGLCFVNYYKQQYDLIIKMIRSATWANQGGYVEQHKQSNTTCSSTILLNLTSVCAQKLTCRYN